jgi:hypothetical protein
MTESAALTDNKYRLLDMLECARRELAIRKSAYPRWVAGGRMAATTAEREILLMGAIVDHLEAELTRG